MAAIRLCPAVRKRARSEGFRLSYDCARSIEGRAENGAPLDAFSIFGHVLVALPLKANGSQAVGGMEVFSYEFQDSVLEFGVKDRADKPAHPYHYRMVERSLKTGFDSLRLTLNLARGNLDEQYACL